LALPPLNVVVEALRAGLADHFRLICDVQEMFIAGYDPRSILPPRSENNRVRGNMKYLQALMDDESRFWIAKEVSDTKYHADVHELFKQGRKVTGKASFHITTDGAPNLHA
jgi:hypothetical protein